ncbi:putative uncharacterized protein DDB_G0282133 [Episyrphus balteatus]|uniref:putative uncharacterized protein DDB_G0282133 n=1 Tax=Episyrphus balteatus TaxID=286459 RepID=UPI002486AB3A|nr:putative uncharacterized protein DDB_G0282133 [Episyrphus balteatus]
MTATTIQPISAASAIKGQQHDQPKSAASANNGQQHFQPISAASAIKGQQLNQNHPLNAMSALKDYKSKGITDQRSPIIRQDEYNLRSERTHNIEPRNQCQNTTSQNFQNNRHNYTNPNKNNTNTNQNPFKNNNYTNQYPNRNNNYTNQNQVNRNNNSYQNQPNGNSPTGQIRNNNASGQARNNGYNNHPQNIQNSGQHRSRQARIEPMEVDYLNYIALIDTGSTISLLNSTRVPSNLYEYINDTPIQINTINGIVNETAQVKTKCPIQFNQPCNARMKWTKVELNKPYDFLIGMDWIRNNAKTIDLKNEEVILVNGIHLPFLTTLLEEVNVLEISEVCNIQTNHLNEIEQESVEKLLNKYKKLIFKEGDQLTNTSAVVHEIKTTTDQQINSKLYSYTPKHEVEVRRL